MGFLERLSQVCAAFDACAIPYVVGGSMASTAWSKPRMTNDADISVMMARPDATCLKAELGAEFRFFPADWSSVVLEEEYPSGEIAHVGGDFRCDVFFARFDEYRTEEFARARSLVIGGRSVRFDSPEDIVLHKLRWFDLGRRVSERQWTDLVQVLEVQGASLDLAYLHRWAERFGIADLLRQALAASLE